MKPTFFRSAAAFRKWLEAHHSEAPELVVGFYHRDSGKGGIGYPDARDEALCFGWIDGVRHNYDATSYVIRFTPRKAGSNWSAVNIGRVRALTADGRMHASGLKVFRAAKKTRNYTYETPPQTLAPAYERELKANPGAWAFFNAQTPGFRRTAIGWVMSAKLEPTRARRLATLIAAAERGTRPAAFLVSRRDREAAR